MGQKRTTLTSHIKAFKNEVLLLLRYYMAWDRIIKFDDIHRISRTEWADKMISLKCIENDLVVRISKFDDADAGVHSFPRALLELRASHPHNAEIINKIKEFQALIKDFKQKRRHETLAHLKIDSRDNLKPMFDLLPSIKIIVEIVDLLDKKETGYYWSDGQFEKYNLRKELLS
jgi:hypothetical protein